MSPTVGRKKKNRSNNEYSMTFPPAYMNCSSASRPDFFLRSSRIVVDLLSYGSKTTDKREQYDWRTEKNSDGMGHIPNEFYNGAIHGCCCHELWSWFHPIINQCECTAYVRRERPPLKNRIKSSPRTLRRPSRPNFSQPSSRIPLIYWCFLLSYDSID